jgi:hypothetical protein
LRKMLRPRALKFFVAEAILVAVSYLMGYNRQDIRLNHKDVRLEKYIIISLSLR